MLLVASRTGVSRGDQPALAKADKPAPAVTPAEITAALREARDAWLTDAKDDPTPHRIFVWQRESIQHSPLLPIASMMARFGDDQAMETAAKIDDEPVRIFTTIQIARDKSEAATPRRPSRASAKPPRC